MTRMHRRRLMTTVFVLLFIGAGFVAQQPAIIAPSTSHTSASGVTTKIRSVLDSLEVKGRAPKTGYARTQFGDGWTTNDGCDTRNIILARDLTHVSVNEKCQVTRGTLNDPYTGRTIEFNRGATTSAAVQIDHVVALSDAWQKGAQNMTLAQRITLANDPLELLAVEGVANQKKSDGDAATWLPSNTTFRCEYIMRQIQVKKKYRLWVTIAEKQAMIRVLDTC